MNGRLRVKSPWSHLGIFLGLLGISLILTYLAMTIVILLMGISLAEIAKPDLAKPELLSAMKVLQAVSSVIIFLVPSLLFALICFRGKPFYFLGLRTPEHPRTYILAILGILLAFPFVMWLGDLNHMIPLPKWMDNLERDATKQMQAFLKADTDFDILVNVFIIAFLPAICEEICFRGVLQRIVINLARSPWAGIILTSIFFSAIHMQFQGFFPRMFLGMILGAIYWYSGSLWPSILAHFVNNAVQVVAVSKAPEYIEKSPAVPLYLALISGLLVWAIIWLFRSSSTITYRKVYDSGGFEGNNQFLV